MTKSEIIAKYGEEAYKKAVEATKKYYRAHREQILENFKERYNENKEKYLEYSRNYYAKNRESLSEYSRKRKESTREANLQKYCSEPLTQIENYEKAKLEDFRGWCIHHRLELHPDFSVRFTTASLKQLNLYYNRPARELIFLRSSEHVRIHHKGIWTEEQRSKQSERMKVACKRQTNVNNNLLYFMI